ncbi:ANTAR domain-containing protein [Rhodococcus rhodnii]|uniref:ANTAR domain-containing protein n=2 Tax=Rhodococcus rhodnii TaxID=38312 RepID=R7WQZ2_9NOCA|nr:GAF and ANTAR domain-containing protein [Rhodococcus rhodnii]EOM77737.1 hypothetical protein Rrhod_0889 [Rhodococcus rhodnii LMG 5362]TXG89018.1 ANTAR domain-containing protein [Rhodococcus rhodnii]
MRDESDAGLRLADVFRELAQVVYDADDAKQIYEAVCEVSVAVVPGCDHASIMLRRREGSTERVLTVAASDEVAARADELERITGEGPCLDALDDEAAQIESDLTSPTTRWPALAARLIAETPIRGALGFRLLVDDRKVGALNLFGDTAGDFEGENADIAVLVAAFASVAVTSAVRGEDASTLRSGIDSNREIGKAIGLLMAQHGVTDDEAFALLQRASSRAQVRIAELASRIVQGHAR